MGRGDANDSILFGDGPVSRRPAPGEHPNEIRAERAERALRSVTGGQDPWTDLTDLLADLHHYAHRHGIEIDQAEERAGSCYAVEIDEDGGRARKQPAYVGEPAGERGVVDPERPINEQRADLGSEVIIQIGNGDEPATDLQDALNDLHHFADRYGIDWDGAYEKGSEAFQGDAEDGNYAALFIG